MALQVWLPLVNNIKNQGSSGATAADSGSSTMSTTEGIIGDTCYAFSGKGNSCLRVTGYPETSGSSEYSIAAWICPSSGSGNQCCPFGIHNNGYWQFGIAANVVRVRDSSTGLTGTAKTMSLGTIPANTWSHVAITYNSGVAKAYVNGVQVGTVTSAAGSTLNTSSHCIVGGFHGGSYFFDGKINDFRIYGNAISAREVQELAKGLVAHWTFNDPGATTIIYDSSGYGRHASCTAASVPVITGSVSPRYHTSVNFSANTKYASASVPIKAIDNNYTFSWWGKVPASTTGGMYWGFISSSTKINMYMSNNYTAWNTSDGSASLFQKPGTTTSIGKLARGNWHHYVITGDGVETLLYVDGTLTGKAKTYKNITYMLSGSVTDADRVIFFPGFSKATTYKLAGTEMSDFRIYATPFTADQVKELYNNPVSVCKNGTLMCMEIVE